SCIEPLIIIASTPRVPTMTSRRLGLKHRRRKENMAVTRPMATIRRRMAEHVRASTDVTADTLIGVMIAVAISLFVATSIMNAAMYHSRLPIVMKAVMEFFATRFELTDSSGWERVNWTLEIMVMPVAQRKIGRQLVALVDPPLPVLVQA